MKGLSRRRLLKSVASLPLIGAVASFLPTGRHTGVTTKELWTTAVARMRQINTAEAFVVRNGGTYMAPSLLPQHVSGYAAINDQGQDKRFEEFWVVSDDEYEVALVDAATGFAMWSNTTGAIFHGEARLPRDPAKGQSLREQLAFSGVSIGAKRQTWAQRFAGMFSPVAYAMAECCSDTEECQCATISSECVGFARACNVGFGDDCNWCCSVQYTNCQYCVPDGCGNPGGSGS